MSVRVLSDVWNHSKAEGGDLLVLLALADFADDSGLCWPSVDTLAKKSRMGERNVRRILRRLEKAGDLTMEPNKGWNGVNRYRVKLGAERQGWLLDTPDILSAPPVATDEGGRTPASETPVAGDPPTVKEPSKNRQKIEILSLSDGLPPSINSANALLELWNSQPGLSKILKLTEARGKALGVRWGDRFFRDHWADAIRRLAKSDFATGKNDRGWVATVDWFLRPDTVARIVEGKYDNRPGTRKSFDDSQYDAAPFGGQKP